MTVPTGFFGDLPAPLGQLNRFMKSISGEIIGMPKAVRGFGHIFSNGIVGRVTIITGRDVLMATLLPTIKLFIHDVAISAVSRVVRKIRISLGVHKGVNPDRKCSAYRDA